MNKRHGRLRALTPFALAALSGIFLIVIFPTWNLVWLAPFALTPLLVALGQEGRIWRRFLLGYIAGNVYWFGICYWIQFVLEVHGGMGRWGGWGSFLVFSLLKSLHLGLFALLAGIVVRQWYAVPAVAALWTGIERTHGDFGFAWLCLGNAGIDMALPMRLAPWVGVYGLSFVFAMMAAGGALVAMRLPRKNLIWLLAIPLLLALPPLPDPEPGSQRAVLVQPNVSEDQEWTPAATRDLHHLLLERSFEAARRSGVGLIVWPEVPGPVYYFTDSEFRSEVTELARRSHAYVLFGTVAFTPRRQPLNSAVLVNPAGEMVDRYDKINLVPFGEYVPEMFGWVNRISQEAGDFVPGSRVVVLPVGNEREGTFICYESAFPHEVREFVKGGAGLLVNISNDGYFGHSAAREQHLELVRMRAAENRRWILRATNDGVTASINPSGRVTKRLPLYQENAGVFDYAYEKSVTAYTEHGDWFAWGCWLIAAVALAASQRPHYTPRRRETIPRTIGK